MERQGGIGGSRKEETQVCAGDVFFFVGEVGINEG